ncbi:STAS domain-containing protein [Mycobacterium angelicum]|uniref:Anti-anti-sigma factor n=1 Tax=Mycobacterium angelicum TaxID=470074 RepID=A0A1W9ZNQ9_MYCAN|nr:STAS domain-containing protein [Mycobacterium angelicum]MCV7196577.1 STAS domain-containing protein [Mycobacterium angelicum]ORA19166.1 anti-anti-sigma factor [Mycobacterium angelicum]
MATPLTLHTESGADGTPRLIATGEIDLSNIARFTRALAEASAGTPETVTVDLTAVKYLDSAGINALFDHADQVDRLHVIVHPFLIRVLTISGLSKIATVEPAPGAADSGSGE